MQGNYFGTAPYLVSPADGIGKFVASPTVLDGSDIEAAVAAAQAADAIVLVVGLFSEVCRRATPTVAAQSLPFSSSSSLPSAGTKLTGCPSLVFLLQGEKPSDEAEGHDRTSLLYPGNQNDLINAVSKAAAGKPITVITMGGGPIDVTLIKNNSAIQSLVWCGYPGQSGGTAIADAIFGTTNTFGKLSLTWYIHHRCRISA